MPIPRASRFVIALLFLTSAAVPAFAQTVPSTGATVPGMTSYDQVITALMEKYGVTGGAVAVARNGKLVFARGYGHANRNTLELAQPDSRFRMASLAKPITSAAILLLVQEGKLGLDDRVFDILSDIDPLPGMPVVDNRLYNITIRQLLNHSGGWNRDTTWDPMFLPQMIASQAGVPSPPGRETIIRWMMGKPLQFAPGTSFNYSNFGYALLGQVIETITGQSYETYVREKILSPSGSACMGIGHTLPTQLLAKEVRYYDFPGAPVVPSVFNGAPVPRQEGGFYLEAMDSHGGWVGSPIEYLRFVLSVDGRADRPDLLASSTIATMTTRPSIPYWNSTAAYYALGWEVRPTGGDANWWHTGGLPGTTTIMVRNYQGVTWAAFFNSQPQNVGPFVQELDNGLWVALAGVTSWPENDQFTSFAPCCTPFFLAQPQDVAVASGGSATLSAAMGNAGTSFSYQWYRGVSGDVSSPVGGNSAQLTVSNITTESRYWVRASAPCGAANSRTAVVSVTCAAPAITQEPADVTVVPGGSATLHVGATGTGPLTYEWYGPGGEKLAVDGPDLVLTNITAAATYWVRVKNGCGFVDSRTVTVGLQAPSFSGLRFVPLTPCRALDTRSSTKIAANASRAVAFAGICGVPADARAISANFTVVDFEAAGYLSLYEEEGPPSRPISSINYGPGQWALANAAIVPLRSGAALTAFAANSSVHLIADVNGYFVAANGTGASAALPFEVVTPCRSSDTRESGGAVQANASRELTISGTCGVPASAAAVSANFTAVDFSGDGYLSIYTERGNPPRPISTMNYSTGQWALANAAILPLRSDGGLTVFSANSPSNVIADVNGYFDGSATLSFHPVTPCRAWDTRESGGPVAANGFRAFEMSGRCGIPAGARAVSVNVTMTGFAGIGFLSAYTELSALPRPISTMNFTAGQWALANAAIVPLRGDGGLTIFVANTPADVILDVNGYFAP